MDERAAQGSPLIEQVDAARRRMRGLGVHDGHVLGGDELGEQRDHVEHDQDSRAEPGQLVAAELGRHELPLGGQVVALAALLHGGTGGRHGGHCARSRRIRGSTAARVRSETRNPTIVSALNTITMLPAR